ncbi:hypothetical protein PR048_023549, partial [Dryococelus australis]
MLSTWMETNKTSKRSEGLRFMLAMKNRAYHGGIKYSLCEAIFGVPMKKGFFFQLSCSTCINGAMADSDEREENGPGVDSNESTKGQAGMQLQSTSAAGA